MKFNELNKGKLLLLILFMLLFVETVAAQNIADTFSNIPALQGLTIEKVVQLYDSFWWLWDFIVYALILSTALKLGAQNSRSFGQSAGKIGGIFAVVLSIGAVFAEKQIGFNLKEFGPLALAIGIFAFGLYLWRTVKGLGLGERSRLILGILYVTIYLLISPRLQGLREAIKSLGWIISIADILFFAFIIFIIIDLVSFLRGFSGGGNGPAPSAPAPAVRQAEAREAAENTHEARDEAGEQQEEQRRMALEAQENAALIQIRNLSFRRDRGFEQIISDLNSLIGALSGMQPSQNLRDLALQKLTEITEISNDIRNVEGNIIAATRRLDNLELVEIAELRKTLRLAKDAVKTELTKKLASKVGKWKPKDHERFDKVTFEWDNTENQLIEKESKLVTSKLIQTRSTLEAHQGQISAAESEFTINFNAAVDFLRGDPNRIASALLRLRAARDAIARAEKIDRYAAKVDVDAIQEKIRTSYNQTQMESRIAGMLGMRLIQGARMAQGAVKAVAQQVVVKGQNLRVKMGGRR